MILEELLESDVDAASFDRSITQGNCHPAAFVGVDTDHSDHRY
jgi:hypothetical protein